jgi:hypothetical protein
MSDFWINFLSNLLADALLAVAVYIIVTKPGEKRTEEQNFKQALSLLRTEIQINLERAKSYIKALDGQISKIDIHDLIPMRFSRGAWNALKEINFLAQIYNAELVYYLLRMNETALVANKNLRKLELCFLEKSSGNKKLLAQTASEESEHLLKIFIRVAEILDQMDLPSYEVELLFEEVDTEVMED